LWWQQLRIIDECRPKFVGWENVEGALSRGCREVAATKKEKLSGEIRTLLAQQSIRDYAFMGATTAQVVLAFNYVYLVWIQRSIPVGMGL
jgi:site-specific DNA-cytosine methylase